MALGCGECERLDGLLLKREKQMRWHVGCCELCLGRIKCMIWVEHVSQRLGVNQDGADIYVINLVGRIL